MLTAAAYSFRLQSRLAISLSWIAGYANVITLTMCGVAVSHVTGNVTHVGQHLGSFNLGALSFVAFLVVAFFFGGGGAGSMLELARLRGFRSIYALPVASEAVVLAVVALTLEYQNHAIGEDRGAVWLMSGAASVAMGIQNATITRISGAVVRTTHLTGVLTDLGLEGSQLLLWWCSKLRGGRASRPRRAWRVSLRHTTTLRIALLVSIFGSFIFGVTAGVLAYRFAPDYAMTVPVAFLIWILYMDWRKTIAEVRQIDPLRDSECTNLLSEPGALPQRVGIYRLTHHRKKSPHHAPDFQLWAGRIPEERRVIVLAVSAMTVFDSDSAMNLTMTARRLKEDGRSLVICGVNPVQMQVLARSGVMMVLNDEDFVDDLQQAVARARGLSD